MGDAVEPDTIITKMLVPHPADAAGPLSTVTVKLERRGGTLWLRYIAQGDVDSAAWPEAQTPERADRLWEHTCFEAFIQTGDGYMELNLSPSGRWAAYRFTSYRQDMVSAEDGVQFHGLERAEDRVALEAIIALPPSATRIALSAVIEARNGSKTYWALAHPSDKPDFHHPDSFTLDLP